MHEVTYTFPLTIGANGQVSTSDQQRHIEEMIEQVLFTSAGERVNRPTFGCGILGYVFEPASTELLAALQALVHGSLQTWLGDVISTEDVSISFDGEHLTVTIVYVDVKTRKRARATFYR